MTFFIQAPVDSAIVSHALEYAFDPANQRLPEVKMPVIQIPRSAKRKYDDGELASAALMMEKLRRTEDLCAVADSPVKSHVRALDRLLDALR